MPNKKKESAKGFRSSTAKSRAKKLYKSYESSAMGKLNPGNALGKAFKKKTDKKSYMGGGMTSSKNRKYSEGGVIQHD